MTIELKVGDESNNRDTGTILTYMSFEKLEGIYDSHNYTYMFDPYAEMLQHYKFTEDKHDE